MTELCINHFIGNCDCNNKSDGDWYVYDGCGHRLYYCHECWEKVRR
jgi:hypothetical protein